MRPTEHHHGNSNDGANPLIDLASDPDDGQAPVFEAPWQARVFGLAVSMHRDGGHFPWQSFQARLAAEIEASEPIDSEAAEAGYYRLWLAALERLMIDEGHLTEDELHARAVEFADGHRTAAEFVEGEHEH